MKTIENDLVKLIYLDLEEWELLLKKPKKLEEKYHLNSTKNQEDLIIQEIMLDLLDKIKKGLLKYEDRVVCAIVYKPENCIVGSISLKSKLKKKKFSEFFEIGYGISKKYWNLGIASNAINLFLKILKENKSLNIFMAETDKDNIASQKVLRKNGFVKIDTHNDSLFWKVEI